MVLETEWQRRICKRINVEGGYAKKWSSQYSVGVPDLIVIRFGATYFFEVKKIEVPDLDKPVSRKLGLTDRQHEEMRRIEEAEGRAWVWLVVEEKATKSSYHGLFLAQENMSWGLKATGQDQRRNLVPWDSPRQGHFLIDLLTTI